MPRYQDILSIIINFFKFRIQIIFRMLLASFLIYFLIFANFGVRDYWHLQKQKKQLESKLINLQNEKAQLLKLVKAISGPVVDINLLEMQVRKILGYARVNEQIFFWK